MLQLGEFLCLGSCTAADHANQTSQHAFSMEAAHAPLLHLRQQFLLAIPFCGDHLGCLHSATVSSQRRLPLKTLCMQYQGYGTPGQVAPSSSILPSSLAFPLSQSELFPDSSQSLTTAAVPVPCSPFTDQTVQTGNPTCSTSEERAESAAKRRRPKKSPPFTEEKTKTLIAIWSEEEVYQQLRKPGMKRPVWEKISKEMKKQGYHRTADQCTEKIRALEKSTRRSKKT